MLGNNKEYSVKKSDLLAKLKTNREKHVAEFNEAVVEYRRRVTVALERKLAAMREGKPIDLKFQLVEPQSFEKDYDRVIGLLEMTTDDIIEITPSDYTAYVLDEWAWKERFSTVAMSYTNKSDE